MESLALLVAVLLVVMFTSSLIASLLAWRTSSRRSRMIASALGLPGALIGITLMTSVDSVGARIYGVIGIAGFVFAAWRAWQLQASAHGPAQQD